MSWISKLLKIPSYDQIKELAEAAIKFKLLALIDSVDAETVEKFREKLKQLLLRWQF